MVRVLLINDEHAFEYVLGHPEDKVTIHGGSYSESFPAEGNIQVNTRPYYEIPDRLKKPLLED